MEYIWYNNAQHNIIWNIMWFCSFLALCGLLFTNLRGLACLGSPTGYVELHHTSCYIYFDIFRGWKIKHNLSYWATLFSDLHYTWPPPYDSVTNRWIEANHTQCQVLRFLYLNIHGCMCIMDVTFIFKLFEMEERAIQF